MGELTHTGPSVIGFAKELGETYGFYKAKNSAHSLVCNAIAESRSQGETDRLSALADAIRDLAPPSQSRSSA
jgi:hypothetical protein